jgi:uncharacterized membrane protein YbhN (UPF0104 family)
MKRALNITVSVAVLALVIWWADAGAVMGHMRGASWGWLKVAGLSLTALSFLMAKRWQVVAGEVDLDISYSRAVAEYYIAQLVNLVLPGGVVGDVARAVRVRHAGDLTRAAQSVAADRIFGQAVMFAALGCGLFIALLVPGGVAWPAITWVGIVLGISVIGVVFVLSRGDGATARFLGLILRLFQNAQLLVLSLIITVLLIFGLYSCARATGTNITPQGWFTLIPLVLSAMLIPLSIGGWGWREGAAAALFPMIGASPSAGIAMGIAYGGMMMIAALPGLYFVMRASLSPSLPSKREMETL